MIIKITNRIKMYKIIFAPFANLVQGRTCFEPYARPHLKGTARTIVPGNKILAEENYHIVIFKNPKNG